MKKQKARKRKRCNTKNKPKGRKPNKAEKHKRRLQASRELIAQKSCRLALELCASEGLTIPEARVKIGQELEPHARELFLAHLDRVEAAEMCTKTSE